MFKKKNPIADHPLKIMVVGCGKVGLTLIEQLSREGNDITLIDKDPGRIADTCGQYDIMGYVGNGASYQMLMDAGITDTDLLIAVTESDELNLLCCTVATQVSSCAAIARVRTPTYSAEVGYLRDRLGLAMVINPELESAREIVRIIHIPSALDVNSFAHGVADMITFKLGDDSILNGMTLMDYMKDKKAQMLFCAVERDGHVTIPNGNYTFAAGDIATFVAHRKDCIQCLSQLGIRTNHVKRCMIVGGGNSSYYLALNLLHNGIRVTIIERNEARCEELSTLLPDATIIRGDGTDVSLLKEEGLDYVDALVSLTDIDEENILLTLHARQTCGAKTITKLSRFSFRDILSELDLGSVVYPRLITSETIIAYARARRAGKDSEIETLYHLFDDQAEAIEFKVKEASDVTGKPLASLSLVDNLILAFISRNGKIFFPSGTDTIEVGDSVMVVTRHHGFNDIRDILK